MPGYIEQLLLKFKHGNPSTILISPYRASPKIYGKGAHAPIPADTTQKNCKGRINIIQKVAGGVLYQARNVNNTVLVALSVIASEQTISSEATKGRVLQLLDYLASKPSVTVRFHASDMVLNVHLNTF